MAPKQTSAKKSTTVATPSVAPETVKVELPAQDDAQKRVRRDVTKETVDSDFSVLLERIETEVARLRASTDKVKVRGIKFLRTVSKNLKTLHNDAKRVMKLKKKNTKRSGAASGFLKPIRISAELATFTGWDANSQYSRVEVTKFICKYIKDHNLFDQNDKRLILVDDKLKRLLNYDPSNPPKDKDGNVAPLNYFRLQRYLKNHFVKVEVPAQPATPAVATSTPATATPAKKGSKKAEPKAEKPKAKRGKKVVQQEEDDDVDVDDE